MAMGDFAQLEERFMHAVVDQAVVGVRERLGAMLSEKDYERLGEVLYDTLMLRVEVTPR